MNLVMALILCNVLVLFYQIIIEIFTILCRINGMTVYKSKFQVISILTGTGFTTSESESMLLTKRRRKLTQYMMMFSYIFNIVIVSTIVNLFMSTSSTNIQEIRLGILLTTINIFLIFIVRKSQAFRDFLDRFVVKIAHSKMIRNENYISVYDNYGNKVIAEVELRKLKESMKDKTIEEIGLKSKYNIQLLVLKRGDEIIDKIGADTVLQEKDVAVVFGKMKSIKSAFIKNEEKAKV